MTKSEFADNVGYEIDDIWFEKINMVLNTFENITDCELAEIWLNDSLCVMESLYESACKADSIKNERDFYKDGMCKYAEKNKELESEISELLTCGDERVEKLETELQQYKAFIAELKNAIKTEPLCFCKGDVCIKDIFTNYGL